MKVVKIPREILEKSVSKDAKDVTYVEEGDKGSRYVAVERQDGSLDVFYSDSSLKKFRNCDNIFGQVEAAKENHVASSFCDRLFASCENYIKGKES